MIINQALSILDRIGIASAPDWLRKCLVDGGGRTRPDGRVVFGRMLPPPSTRHFRNQSGAEAIPILSRIERA